MATSDFSIRQGDTAPVFAATLVDENGDAVDLTLISDAELRLAPAAGGSVLALTGDVDVVGDPVDGEVEYAWSTADTAEPGLYLAEVVVTWADGKVMTFPNEDAIELAITKRVGDLKTGDLLALAPELEPARADFLLAMSTRVVAAYLWPNLIADPVPPTIELVILRHALSLARATTSTSGAIVSESVGSYTYRLAAPTSIDDALALSDELRRELAPWAPAGRRATYDVDTFGESWSWPWGFGLLPTALSAYPANVFQHDADNLLAAEDAALREAAGL